MTNATDLSSIRMKFVNKVSVNITPGQHKHFWVKLSHLRRRARFDHSFESDSVYNLKDLLIVLFTRWKVAEQFDAKIMARSIVGSLVSMHNLRDRSPG